MITLTITEDNAGSRLDRIIRKNLPLRPLSDIYRLIRVGQVTVNEKKSKQERRVLAGDIVRINVDSSELRPAQTDSAEALRDLARTDFYKRNFSVIYEDEDLLACNKPGGLVVHPGSGHETHDTLIDLVACYFASPMRAAAAIEPVLVHRIDRDTSGIILIAKNKRILRRLHESFRERDIDKKYVAVCHGRTPKKKGVIEANLIKTVELNSGTKVSVHETGLYSKTEYSVVRSNGALTLLEVTLGTGRTHQIRVHLAHIGCPIVGDIRYGDKELDHTLFSEKRISRRLYLHAAHIGFFHPMKKKLIELMAPIPECFEKILDA